MVDKKFVALFKTTLSRLAGAGLFNSSFIDHEFWLRWPKKFREKKRYEKKCEEEETVTQQPLANSPCSPSILARVSKITSSIYLDTI